jgi:hypothetical protein
MTRPAPLLLQALREPSAKFGLGQWDLLLRQADRADLTVSLLYHLEDHGLLAQVPAQPRERLEWTRARAERHRQAVDWEVNRIRAALHEVEPRLVLLKGAAYQLAGLPCARGRLFSDIDVLVAHERLGQVEGALMLNGWVSGHHDAYDQRYYREWMHELPPMQHAKRQTVIDVHHAILPRTAAARPDPARLRAAARPLPGHPGLYVLAPADMVLHSAVHLFYEGEFNHGLRDLFDLHRLLLHFAAQPGFWDELPARARELGLERPLFYALRYCGGLLHTPVPAATLAAAGAGRPNRLLLALMDQLFGRALLPDHASCSDWFSASARFLLYIRGNWLRMPPLMLSRHLFHKAFLSPRPAQRADA